MSLFSGIGTYCPEDLLPVREPQIEALTCTEEYYPELVQAVKEAKAQEAKAWQQGDDRLRDQN